MKDNLLEEEVYQIRKMRGQTDPVEEYRRKLALEFLGSSEVTKEILEKKGYQFFGEAKPMSYFENKLKLLGTDLRKKGYEFKGNEKPPYYGH